MPEPLVSTPHQKTAMRLALAGSAFLALLAGGAFFYAARIAGEAEKQAGGGDGVRVTILADACAPNELTVPAGRVRFDIINRSERAVEWEILDGVMVVEERENIAPGFTQTMRARLDPGDYDITCGLPGNPRGKLHVMPSQASDGDAARPPLTAFIGALAEYKVYLRAETAVLTGETSALGAAIRAGDMEKARALYAPARAAYDRMAPVTDLFSDLDRAIDAQADYYEKLEADPAFTGFHRLELGLFGQSAGEGDLSYIAERLETDVKALGGRIASLRLPPEKMIGGAAMAMDRLASVRIEAGVERHAGSDLADFDNMLAGSRKVATLFRPLVEKGDADLAQRIDTDAAALQAAIDRLREEGGFRPYASVTREEKATLKEKAAVLAADLSQAREKLGLN